MERLFTDTTEHEAQDTVESIQLADINQGAGELRVGMKIKAHKDWQGAYLGAATGIVKEIIPRGETRYSGNGTHAYIIVLELKNWRGKKRELRINTDSGREELSIQILD